MNTKEFYYWLSGFINNKQHLDEKEIGEINDKLKEVNVCDGLSIYNNNLCKNTEIFLKNNGKNTIFCHS